MPDQAPPVRLSSIDITWTVPGWEPTARVNFYCDNELSLQALPHFYQNHQNGYGGWSLSNDGLYAYGFPLTEDEQGILKMLIDMISERVEFKLRRFPGD